MNEKLSAVLRRIPEEDPLRTKQILDQLLSAEGFEEIALVMAVQTGMVTVGQAKDKEFKLPDGQSWSQAAMAAKILQDYKDDSLELSKLSAGLNQELWDRY